MRIYRLGTLPDCSTRTFSIFCDTDLRRTMYRKLCLLLVDRDDRLLFSDLSTSGQRDLDLAGIIVLPRTAGAKLAMFNDVPQHLMEKSGTKLEISLVKLRLQLVFLEVVGGLELARTQVADVPVR